MPNSNAVATGTGGVVLCGGRSARMGRPKAWLPWEGGTLLQRVAETLEAVVSPVVVVAAPGQELPPLPASTVIVRDEAEHLGPLSGIAGGLQALAGRVEAAYVSACDVPLLRPEFVAEMIRRRGDADVAIAVEPDPDGRGERCHPLAAVYRTWLAEAARALVQQGRLRPIYLLESVRVCRVPTEELRAVDGGLDSLRNVNSPEEYAALVAGRAPETFAAYGGAPRDPDPRPRQPDR